MSAICSDLVVILFVACVGVEKLHCVVAREWGRSRSKFASTPCRGRTPNWCYLAEAGLPRKIRESPVQGTNPKMVDFVIMGLPREIRESPVQGTNPMV